VLKADDLAINDTTVTDALDTLQRQNSALMDSGLKINVATI